jgi:hypothetical protein
MGRDLLYRPQPLYTPEEEAEGKGKKKSIKNGVSQAKTKVRGPRNLGHVGRTVAKQISEANQASGAKAHKHAYFNNDISGVGRPNLGTHQARSLRGNQEAADLRKVVLPPNVLGIEHPDPGILQGAMDLMGVQEGFAGDLAGLLGRQGAWARSKTMTIELLKEKMRQLEMMVDARKAALGRMAEGKSEQPITSVTLLQAAQSAGTALEQVDDVASAGNDLIQQTSGQAAGLHARMAKMFGVKIH